MLLTIAVKLSPTREQHDSLLKTMEKFNDACNYITGIAFKQQLANKVRLHKIVYYDTRERFGLSAQMVVRAIGKVVEVYKRDKSIRPKFRPHGAMVYDERILSWKALDRVSILTLEGRVLVPAVIGDYQRQKLRRVRGQADLIYRDKTFYLMMVVDVPEDTPIKPTGALGVDLGIVNIAVDSDGEFHSGEQVERNRVKNTRLRAALQKAGTKRAKKHLKKLSGREARFRKDTNHRISKRIVAKAKDTKQLIALEDLSGIRSRTTVKKAQRGRHHSWGFYQLRQFIEYKAAIAGIPVMYVDPKYTSQTCPRCGAVDKRNRATRDRFSCVQCGFAGFADHIAAINIAARAVVNQPIVSGCEHLSSVLLQGQALDFSRG